MIIVNGAPKHGGYFLMRVVALMGYKHYVGNAVRWWPDSELTYGAGKHSHKHWHWPWPVNDVEAGPEPKENEFLRGYIAYNSDDPIPHKIITISRDPRNAALSWMHSRLGSKYGWLNTEKDLMRLLRECGKPIGKNGTFVDFCRGYLGWFPDQGVWMEDILTDDGYSIRKIMHILGGSKENVNFIQENAFGGDSNGTLGPGGVVLISRQSSWRLDSSWLDYRKHKLWTKTVDAAWQDIGGADLIEEIKQLRIQGKTR